MICKRKLENGEICGNKFKQIYLQNLIYCENCRKEIWDKKRLGLHKLYYPSKTNPNIIIDMRL